MPNTNAITCINESVEFNISIASDYSVANAFGIASNTKQSRINQIDNINDALQLIWNAHH